MAPDTSLLGLMADKNARIIRLAAENQKLRSANRQLLDALSAVICHLHGHPGIDQLLADLKNSSGPPACTAEGPTSPESTSTGDLK